MSKDQLVEWKKIDRLNFKTSATMIRSSPLVQQFLDPPAQRIGDTNRRSTARCLAQWFLRRASQTTCEHAAQCLDAYLHSDTFLAHEVMLIAGITTDTDAKLTDDITIGPWRARPAILREAQFEREELLVVRREISLPRVHESEPGASDGWISTGSPTGSDVLKGVNLCLTVATDAAHIVRAEWISPHPDVPLGSEQSGWTAPMT